MSIIYVKRTKVLWYFSLQKYIFNPEYGNNITQKCKKQERSAKLHKSVTIYFGDIHIFATEIIKSTRL